MRRRPPPARAAARPRPAARRDTPSSRRLAPVRFAVTYSAWPVKAKWTSTMYSGRIATNATAATTTPRRDVDLRRLARPREHERRGDDRGAVGDQLQRIGAAPPLEAHEEPGSGAGRRGGQRRCHCRASSRARGRARRGARRRRPRSSTWSRTPRARRAPASSAWASAWWAAARVASAAPRSGVLALRADRRRRAGARARTRTASGPLRRSPSRAARSVPRARRSSSSASTWRARRLPQRHRAELGVDVAERGAQLAPIAGRPAFAARAITALDARIATVRVRFAHGGRRASGRHESAGRSQLAVAAAQSSGGTIGQLG